MYPYVERGRQLQMYLYTSVYMYTYICEMQHQQCTRSDTSVCKFKYVGEVSSHMGNYNKQDTTQRAGIMLGHQANQMTIVRKQCFSSLGRRTSTRYGTNDTHGIAHTASP